MHLAKNKTSPNLISTVPNVPTSVCTSLTATLDMYLFKWKSSTELAVLFL